MSIKVWFQIGTVWDLLPEVQEGFRQVVKHAKQDVYVTSGREGKHHPASLHYSGKAWDMRHSGYDTSQELYDVLPGGEQQWDVVGYTWGWHIELDPK